MIETPRLLIDDKIPYIRGHAERLGTCTYMPGSQISRADVQKADILVVRTRTQCNAALLEGSPVGLVVSATSGFDHLDTEFLDRAGIAWRNCPASNAMSVVQYVVCSLLVLDHIGTIDWNNLCVGIVGVGNVGSRLQSALNDLGVRTLLCDPPRAEQGEQGFIPLAEIARRANVVTFHTPLTHSGPHKTHHLADANFFAACAENKPVLINAARGGVVDEALLLRALDCGNIKACVVDTWEGEPQINRELLQKAIIATPHIAGYSADGKANATRMALQAVAHWLGRTETFDIQPPSLPFPYQYNPLQAPFCPALRYYDPLFDTAILKTFPALFEQLRSHYPLRREGRFYE